MSKTRVIPSGMHQCAAGEGYCEKIVSDRLLMCATHWRMVPKAEQTALWRVYVAIPGGSGRAKLTPSYVAAMLTCVTIVRATIDGRALNDQQQQRMPL